MLQGRGAATAGFEYSGMPTPPEAMIDVISSPEAKAQFDAGEGGPLAVTPLMSNGVYGAPLGMWLISWMMGYLGVVRPPLAVLMHVIVLYYGKTSLFVSSNSRV